MWAFFQGYVLFTDRTKKESSAFVVGTVSQIMGMLSWVKTRVKSSCSERKKGRAGRSHSWLLRRRQHCGCHRNRSHYGDHFQMATGLCPGKEHSVPGVWTELSLWIPGGEHQILPEGWEADAGIPDPSRTTPTSGLAACVSPEGD